MQFINFRSVPMLIFFISLYSTFFYFVDRFNSWIQFSHFYFWYLQDYVATRWYRAPELCGSFFSKVYAYMLSDPSYSGKWKYKWDMVYISCIGNLPACIDCCAYTLTSVCEAYYLLEFNFLVCACITGSHVCCLWSVFNASLLMAYESDWIVNTIALIVSEGNDLLAPKFMGL